MKSGRILLLLALLLVATLGVAADPVSVNGQELRLSEEAETKFMEGGISRILRAIAVAIGIAITVYAVLVIPAAVILGAISDRRMPSPVEVSGVRRGTLRNPTFHDI